MAQHIGKPDNSDETVSATARTFMLVPETKPTSVTRGQTIALNPPGEVTIDQAVRDAVMDELLGPKYSIVSSYLQDLENVMETPDERDERWKENAHAYPKEIRQKIMELRYVLKNVQEVRNKSAKFDNLEYFYNFVQDPLAARLLAEITSNRFGQLTPYKIPKAPVGRDRTEAEEQEIREIRESRKEERKEEFKTILNELGATTLTAKRLLANLSIPEIAEKILKGQLHLEQQSQLVILGEAGPAEAK